MVIKAGPLASVAAGKTLIYQLAISAVLLPIGSWLLGEPGIVSLNSFSIASLVYQGVWIAGITYLAWFWLFATILHPSWPLSLS